MSQPTQTESGRDDLQATERQLLLKLARQALEAGVNRQSLPPLDFKDLPPVLQQLGATFVTLTIRGELRGCVGTLEALHPLAEDVREHAVSAALHDYRFPPVIPDELPVINIEISRLTTPVLLKYEHPKELPTLLRPHIDGVVLADGVLRATFLPQVWEKIPDPILFLRQLCLKMGAPADLWQRKLLKVYTYQVEEFHE